MLSRNRDSMFCPNDLRERQSDLSVERDDYHNRLVRVLSQNLEVIWSDIPQHGELQQCDI